MLTMVNNLIMVEDFASMRSSALAQEDFALIGDLV